MLGARRSTDPAPMPLNKEAVQAACVAFGFLGNDKDTQIFVLKMMKAIEAYLRAAGDFHKPPAVN